MKVGLEEKAAQMIHKEMLKGMWAQKEVARYVLQIGSSVFFLL